MLSSKPVKSFVSKEVPNIQDSPLHCAFPISKKLYARYNGMNVLDKALTPSCLTVYLN